jgi:hypothetical protein
MSKPAKRKAGETLDAIFEMHLDDELERIAAMSDEDLDAEVRALGGDPEGIRNRGAAFVTKERARIESLSKLRADAASRLARALEAKNNAPKTPALPRKELLARIDKAMSRPTFGAQVALAFKNRKRETASDEELRSFLDTIAELEAIAEAEGMNGSPAR